MDLLAPRSSALRDRLFQGNMSYRRYSLGVYFHTKIDIDLMRLSKYLSVR